MSLATTRPRHVAATLAVCAVPIVGLVAFLLWAHRGQHLVHPPSAGLLGALAVAGAVVPGLRVVVVWRWLLADPRRFHLDLLVQMYASLILGFASVFVLLQASSTTPHFSGMAMLWTGEADTLQSHLWGLGSVSVDALYLSVVTITTVGFGDIVATRPLSRLVVASEALTGVAYVSLVLGRYFSYCSHTQRALAQSLHPVSQEEP